MKACVLHDIGNIKVEEVLTPSPGKGEVLIKIKASGICGSDIPRIFSNGTYHFPTIPGHEFAGQIIKLTGNTTLTTKDTVTDDLIIKTKNIITSALEQDLHADTDGVVKY